jgi:hypothetical protein
MTFLSAAELERLASQIPDPYGVLVRFLGWTGLRIGRRPPFGSGGWTCSPAGSRWSRRRPR